MGGFILVGGGVVAVGRGDETEQDEEGGEEGEAEGYDRFGTYAVAEEADEGGEEGGDREDEEDEGYLRGVVGEEELDAEGEDGFETGEDDGLH